ncbi:MAG: hypothetical protein CVU20_04685 [Betaproteobacteria bacterium HGW-Betaproteobacteria-14]|nr:MAG: hypothetical protein CVU20_04685 [Betaproteobacteria bacterium HGW-Betaproteobacteria-14]
MLISTSVLSILTMLVLTVVICSLLLSVRKDANVIPILIIGCALLWWGLGDARLPDELTLEALSNHRRSRAFFPGLACLAGAALYWFLRKHK